MYRINIRRNVLLPVLLVLGFLLISALLGPSASAAPQPATDNAKCLLNGGEYNAVIFVRVLNNDGTLNHYSDHFTFTVQSYKKANTDGDGYAKNKHNSILKWENGVATALGPGPVGLEAKLSGAGALPYGDGTPPFGNGNMCDPDNNAGGKVLGYAFRSGDGTNHYFFPSGTKNDAGNWVYDRGPKNVGKPGNAPYDNNGSLSLSCLDSNATSYQFNITGIYGEGPGTWEQGKAGGNDTWPSATTVNLEPNDGEDINHTEGRIYFTYRLDPPPVLTPLAGLSGGNSGEVEAGDVVTPSASITRSGSGDPTVTWTWWFWYDQDLDGSYDTGEQIAGGRITPLTGSSNAYPAALTGYSGAAVPPDKRSICSRLLLTSTTAGSYSPPDGDSKATCYTIVRRPYFRIMNGDANATGVVQDANGVCSGAPSSTIQAFNKGAGAAFKGAGADVAVFATGSVKEFVSAALVDTIRPKGLTFSNTAGDATYGGGFGQTYCIPNYWASPTATAPYTATATTGSVVVDGDVFVTGSPDTASFALNDIPLRWVVASSNIYISKDVENLAGNYVAKGKIYTCATGAGAQVPQASMITDCSKPLTVNGTFIAGSGVVFQRTAGSLNGDPAERIIYTPEIWLQSFRPQAGAPNNVRYNGKFDSIIMLPPVL